MMMILICSNHDEDYEDDDAIVNICKHLIRVNKHLIRVSKHLIRVNKHLIIRVNKHLIRVNGEYWKVAPELCTFPSNLPPGIPWAGISI